MQEIHYDGSKGEIKEFSSLEEMLPELEKSLAKKEVKYVKVFRIQEGGKTTTEEVNKGLFDVLEEPK